jgi:DNA-binding transcriptional MerR regulator
MYRIGEFSRLARTTVKTLRYYDEVGLLKPEGVDPFTGYRHYTTRQLYPLTRIMSLRQAGLGVEEVRRVLDGLGAADVLAARHEELRQELTETQERLTRLTCIINHMQEDETMQHQATVKTLPACAAYVREGVVPAYADITAFIGETAREVFAQNPTLEMLDPPYTFISYLDGEYRETDIRIRFAQAVKVKGRDTANVAFQTLEPVQAACVYHRGPYDGVGAAYAFALNWVEQNGYRVAGLARECYIDGIWNKPDPADWLTEIQIPVLKG